MSLYERIIRPLAFNFDPEKIHERVMSGLERGLFQARKFSDPRLKQTLFGVEFENPLGLAAGFDKNAAAIDHWHRLGFGFVEIGTVTHLAQPGNPKPRMFRLPEDRALINRLGFNNIGAAAVAGKLAKGRPSLPLGINLGKSRITALADAPEDYKASFELLHTYGSYFVVNVSSPNTPGLRSLQEKRPLLEILSALREVDSTRPIFVKVAPDLEDPDLDNVIEVAQEASLTGLIATNTTIHREGLISAVQEEGGLSGAPLFKRSNEVLARLYQGCARSMVLMGVGGIFTGSDLYEKIRLGANLCQLYTGWIYGGPQMVPNVLEELVTLMQRDGMKSIEELRGSGVK
jgi:dihydroorotate dehydrogenase